MSDIDETAADTAAGSTTTDDATATTSATATDAQSDTATRTTDNAATRSDDTARASRKVREGNVVSDKMEKTVVVAVIERIRHPKYGKFMMRTKKLYAHDEANDAHVGDKVRVMETRPLSKNKRWRVVEVLERAK
jgi:small subunit ribosomal protein S17